MPQCATHDGKAVPIVIEHRRLDGDDVIVSTQYGEGADGRGFVELRVNQHRAHLTARKAQEIAHMLVEAAEAAISDQIMLDVLIEIGIVEPRRQLLKLREKRQGTRDPSWPT
jgi:hypothetical protein